MKIKIICFIGVLGLLISCNGGSSSSPSVKDYWHITCNSGSWEGFHFEDNGEFLISSFEEVLKGTYSIDKSEARPLMKVRVTYDNGGTDCIGQIEDNTGQIFSYYYEVTKKNLKIYDSVESDLPLAIYTRYMWLADSIYCSDCGPGK